MTFKEALNSGYRLADRRWFRGYVSRRVSINDQPVLIAGGSRRGEPYVDLPCWSSTTYHIRQYLVKEG